MKTLFAAIVASAFISTPAFADDANINEILAGNAAELSTIEMEETTGAGNFAFVNQNQTTVVGGDTLGVLAKIKQNNFVYNNQNSDVNQINITKYFGFFKH